MAVFPHEFHNDPEDVQTGRPQSRNPQKRDTAHDAPFLCHGTSGSGRRPADYRPVVGTQELHDNDGLSPRTPSASGIDAQSDRLVASAAAPRLATAE